MRQYVKEPFPACSHFVGVILSVVAMLALLHASGTNGYVLLASSIYGASLIALYLASSLMHGVHCSERLAKKFELCDHAAIFLLIAGTYTPVCLLIINSKLGAFLLISEWVLAAIGIADVFFGTLRSRTLQVVIYLTMGWLFLFAIGPLSSTLTNSLLVWLIAGGAAYSIGAIIFLTDWPHIHKSFFTAHDLWHVLVLVGSACHFVVINHYVHAVASASLQ